jgi:hypothetical protein
MKKHEKGQYFRDFIVFLKDPHPYHLSFVICHLLFVICLWNEPIEECSCNDK